MAGNILLADSLQFISLSQCLPISHLFSLMVFDCLTSTLTHIIMWFGCCFFFSFNLTSLY